MRKRLTVNVVAARALPLSQPSPVLLGEGMNQFRITKAQAGQIGD
jgi:hypothetical protein